MAFTTKSGYVRIDIFKSNGKSAVDMSEHYRGDDIRHAPQPRARRPPGARKRSRKRGHFREVASALLAVTIGSLSIRQCEPKCVYASDGSTVYAARSTAQRPSSGR